MSATKFELNSISLIIAIANQSFALNIIEFDSLVQAMS